MLLQKGIIPPHRSKKIREAIAEDRASKSLGALPYVDLYGKCRWRATAMCVAAAMLHQRTPRPANHATVRA